MIFFMGGWEFPNGEKHTHTYRERERESHNGETEDLVRKKEE